MTARRRVGLVFGGASVEHEVSVVSARGIAGALDPSRFAVVPIGITLAGRWLSPERSAAILASTEARVEGSDAADDDVVVVPGAGLARRTASGTIAPLGVDVVFPVVHGWGGEDGRLQGLCDLARLPCVGAGVLGSAVGMDKQVSKVLLAAAGLPVAPWRPLRIESWRRDPRAAERAIADELGFPLFAKPANGGSSVGITKVKDPAGLHPALASAFEHDRKVVIERGLDAREVECAVLGDETPQASVPGEILPAGEFYDYASKYQDIGSKLEIPARLPSPLAERIRGFALAAFAALDLSGMARVDFFVEKGTEAVFVNEANTLPGFTPISMYPKLWEATGLPYPELLARLIDLARRRSTGAPTRHGA